MAMKYILPYAPEAVKPFLPAVAFPLANLLALFATIKRIQNVGMSGWWFFGLFVPGLNLWILYRCLACPSGYAVVKKLDAIGMLLAFLYWGGLIALVVALATGVAGSLGEMKSSGMLEELMKQFNELRASALPDR
jgi:uncharacterized membrane protein YhaH (DUF805 family)